MLGHYVESAASLSHGVVAGFPGPVRRHLAIVDQSRLRSDCLSWRWACNPGAGMWWTPLEFPS
jgi:hypothetical protein